MAARWVGWDTVGFCEIDPYCQKVLKKHWPDVPIYDDIRSLTGEQIGPVDVISGGYPCQPFSVAGERRGEEDDRHLWPEFARLIQELKPSYSVLENVAGHISMGLDQVLSDLESFGYEWESFVIPACAVGAPHRRDRIWIIAYTDSFKRCKGSAKEQIFWECNLQIESKRGFEGFRGRRHISTPELCGTNDGIPNRSHRLRGLGNSIVPQIAEVIFRSIDEVHKMPQGQASG